jgi:hypothetical protein
VRAYLKKPITKKKKKAGGVAQGVAPEFKPQYQKKKERYKIKSYSHYSRNSVVVT